MAKGSTFLTGYGEFSSNKQAGASSPAPLPKPHISEKNISHNNSPHIHNEKKMNQTIIKENSAATLQHSLYVSITIFWCKNNYGLTIVTEDVLKYSEM
jgi:hypothetical protein